MSSVGFNVGHHAMTWQGYAAAEKQPFDFDRFLVEARESGYANIEIGANVAGLTAPQVRDACANAGVNVAAVSCNVTANPWPPNTADYRKTMEFAGELGVNLLMVCGGFLGARRTTFDDDYKLFAENLTAAQAYADQFGQILAYHPHRGCMVETDAELQRLMKYIPSLQLTIDTGHLAAVRESGAALIRKYGQRVRHIHLKDYEVETSKFAELGTGTARIDFADVLAALAQIGFAGTVVVERDAPPIPAVESARISRRFLRSLGV